MRRTKSTKLTAKLPEKDNNKQLESNYVSGLVDMSIRKLFELLTSEQVANLTGLSLDTLAQWRSQKCGIPYWKVGRNVRCDADDVQSCLAGCRVSVSDPHERRQIK